MACIKKVMSVGLQIYHPKRIKWRFQFITENARITCWRLHRTHCPNDSDGTFSRNSGTNLFRSDFHKRCILLPFLAQKFTSAHGSQMDPTVGQVIADANHIQLQGGILESDTLVEFTEGIFRTLNQLENRYC